MWVDYIWSHGAGGNGVRSSTIRGGDIPHSQPPPPSFDLVLTLSMQNTSSFCEILTAEVQNGLVEEEKSDLSRQFIGLSPQKLE